MPRILVNCHGGRVANNSFAVPAGVTINFYVGDGQILDNGPAWQILSGLQSNQALPQGTVVQQITAGNQCWEYYGVPYNKLEVVNGVLVERPSGRRRPPYFDPILESGGGQQWGAPAANTVNVYRPVLPAVQGGQAYARDAILLSDIANYASANNFTHVDWISCREHW